MNNDAKRFLALDSWRGVCAILVAAHHFFMATANNHEYTFVKSFFMFVDFFFVLSGFVIATRYESDISSVRHFIVFIIKRVARIWPLHACVMLSFAIFIGYLSLSGEPSPYTIGASPTAYDIRKFPLVLALTNSLGLYSGGWNLPSWSISAELVAYLVFGLIFMSSRRALITVMVITAAGLFIWFRGGDYISGMTAKYGAIRCLFGFGIGVVCHYIYCKFRRVPFFLGSWRRGLYTAVEAAAILIMISYLLISTGPGYTATAASIAVPLIFGLVILIFVPEAGAISRLLKTKYVIRLGEISYSVYMVHLLVLLVMSHLANAIGKKSYIFRTLWGTERAFWDLTNDFLFVTMFAIFLIVVIIVSLFTFRYVEDPCRRLGARYADKIGASLDLKRIFR